MLYIEIHYTATAKLYYLPAIQIIPNTENGF